MRNVCYFTSLFPDVSLTVSLWCW